MYKRQSIDSPSINSDSASTKSNGTFPNSNNQARENIRDIPTKEIMKENSLSIAETEKEWIAEKIPIMSREIKDISDTKEIVMARMIAKLTNRFELADIATVSPSSANTKKETENSVPDVVKKNPQGFLMVNSSHANTLRKAKEKQNVSWEDFSSMSLPTLLNNFKPSRIKLNNPKTAAFAGDCRC